MRHVTFFARLIGFVNRLKRQHLARMAVKAVVVIRRDPSMGLVALVAVQPRHGYPVREARF